MDRALLKQAKAALKQGNTKVAIKNTKQVLKRSPRNIFAKRFMNQISDFLYEEAEKSVDAKRYADAVKKLDELLELDDAHEEAKILRGEARKHMLVADGNKALKKDNPMAALRMAREALRIDPQLAEAKKLEKDANEKVDEKIVTLMSTAEKLIEQKNFEKLRDLAQDILTIDPQNREVAELLREAQAQILARNKDQNMRKALEFYEQGIYESALARAEEVLKVDPNSIEAKRLVEKSKAEMTKPELRLTGLSKIKSMEIAHIEIPSIKERFQVKVGDVFADFEVSAIDFDLKTVDVVYVKTGSITTITTQTE